MMVAESSRANLRVTSEGIVVLSWGDGQGGPPVLAVEMDAATARSLGEELFKAGSVADQVRGERPPES